MNYREIIATFLNNYQENAELKAISNMLLECWIHGFNQTFVEISDENNLKVIKDLFASIYNEGDYSIVPWGSEYKINWLLDFQKDEFYKDKK